MAITPIYAGLITLFFIALSFQVFGARGKAGVSLGDGGDKILLRKLRAHGNFAEYVPLVLILMALAELSKAPALLIHAIGVIILVGRLMHGYALSQETPVPKLRYYGTVLTMMALLVGAGSNLVFALITF